MCARRRKTNALVYLRLLLDDIVLFCFPMMIILIFVVAILFDIRDIPFSFEMSTSVFL